MEVINNPHNYSSMSETTEMKWIQNQKKNRTNTNPYSIIQWERFTNFKAKWLIVAKPNQRINEPRIERKSYNYNNNQTKKFRSDKKKKYKKWIRQFKLSLQVFLFYKMKSRSKLFTHTTTHRRYRKKISFCFSNCPSSSMEN